MITITIINTIAITIAIAIAIISISPRPNVHTCAHNWWEEDTRFRCKIWVGDMLTPRWNCLPLLRDLRLQLSTPWSWGIVRSCHGGRAKDKIEPMILTDLMISATIRRLPSATHHMPHAARQTLPTIHHLPSASRCLASATQEFSGLFMQECTLEYIVKWDCECLPSWECTCEWLGGVLGCVLGGVLGSVLRAYLGAYSQAAWEGTIECNWKCTWEHAWECDWEHLVSWLCSV